MTTQTETCEHCGSEMTQFQENGNHWFKCGSIKNIFRGTPCLDHQMKSLNERIDRITAAGDAIVDEIRYQPEPNLPGPDMVNLIYRWDEAKGVKL